MISVIPFGLSRFRVITGMIVFVALGLMVSPFLQVQLMPTPKSSDITVVFNWQGASPRALEEEVTSRLEAAFSTANGLENITSQSHKGMGMISMLFKDHIDIDVARFEISCLVRDAYSKLPQGVDYPTIMTNAAGVEGLPLMAFTLNSKAQPQLLKEYAEEKIVQAFTRIKDVGRIEVNGGSEKAWEIKLNSTRARFYGITSSDVWTSVETQLSQEFIGSAESRSGLADSSTVLTVVIQAGELSTVNWKHIPVKKSGDKIIHLGDVAEVSLMDLQPKSYFRINGKNTVSILVYPQPNVNHLTLAKALSTTFKSVKQALPSDFGFILVYDSTSEITSYTRKISIRVLVSMAAVFLLIWLRTRTIKLPIIIIGLTSLVMVTSLFILFILGVQLNLYSLGAFTMAFGLVLANLVIAADHLKNDNDTSIAPALLGACAALIATLALIFLLPQEHQINLIDFAIIVAVNLILSLLAALLVLPALFEAWLLEGMSEGRAHATRVNWFGWYAKLIAFNLRFRSVYIFSAIFLFGIPLFLLPVALKDDSAFASVYNNTIGNPSFTNGLRPLVERITGGSLRLFVNSVGERSSFSGAARTKLIIRTSMPEGRTLLQMNNSVSIMEEFLQRFGEIELFQTSIHGIDRSQIVVFFKPEEDDGNAPIFIKSLVERKANTIGAADWNIYGIGKGFSNAISDTYKSEKIILEGYEFETLHRLALNSKTMLERNNRVKDLEIVGTTDWQATASDEYHFRANEERTSLSGIDLSDLYRAVYDNRYLVRANKTIGKDQHAVILSTSAQNDQGVWELQHEPLTLGNTITKLSELGVIERQKSASAIYKKNQQYQLVLAYNFLGAPELSSQVQRQHVEQVENDLPLGYSVRAFSPGQFDSHDPYLYFLIVILCVILYFVMAILFESLRQPLVILGLIPISYIGVFLSFSYSTTPFDEGGLASFILTTALAIFSGIMLLFRFNIARKEGSDACIAFVKSFEYTIVPSVIGMSCLALYLLPFLFDSADAAFWRALATGSLGGFLFVIIALTFYLPIFLIPKKRLFDRP